MGAAEALVRQGGSMSRPPLKPLVGVLCCNEFLDRPVQSVATRFVEPLVSIAQVDVLLVPALPDTVDVRSLAARLDGLLLTGSRSNVAASAYGQQSSCSNVDLKRDRMAFALATELIEAAKPVFGICRGFQELNVLFGGSLRADVSAVHCHPEASSVDFERLFTHRHRVHVLPGGLLAETAAEPRQIEVNSVHEQGIDRLGNGLRVEAISHGDGLIEAISTTSGGAAVLAVQWHPEWETGTCETSRTFFEKLGAAAA